MYRLCKYCYCCYLFSISTETPFVLTFNDLPVLSTRLRSISPKWYNLGFYLGLTIDELNHLVPTVEANCDAAVYLNKVLSAWLQRTNPNPPTLEELCRALAHAAIGEEKLALQLLQRKFNHCYRDCLIVANNFFQHFRKNSVLFLLSLQSSNYWHRREQACRCECC